MPPRKEQRIASVQPKKVAVQRTPLHGIRKVTRQVVSTCKLAGIPAATVDALFAPRPEREEFAERASRLLTPQQRLAALAVTQPAPKARGSAATMGRLLSHFDCQDVLRLVMQSLPNPRHLVPCKQVNGLWFNLVEQDLASRFACIPKVARNAVARGRYEASPKAADNMPVGRVSFRPSGRYMFAKAYRSADMWVSVDSQVPESVFSVFSSK